MKVGELRNFIYELGFNDDEELCVLIYDKSMFVDEDNNESVLTEEGWSKVVQDFEQCEFNDIYESIMMAVVDYSEDKE